ncbi:TetR/AcrR family transcriptional regulator [Hyphococcus sp. DH-69]|uniref:TetR/AcrR family transcriptional regulator n=1 Tax=Hyphococcus formosus TaxID=3143534 RepID=UPI00398AEC58
MESKQKPVRRKTRGKVQAARRSASMTSILNHAETVFAIKGFNASFKEVAQEAGVDTALLRYYFGNKSKLFKAVFQRRAPKINDLRLKAMAEYRKTCNGEMTLEGIIDAFVRPSLEMSIKDKGWRNYMAIVAYVNSSGGELDQLMSETFDHVSQELISDMRKILVDASDQELYWGYHFLTGAFTFSLGQTGRIDILSQGEVSSKDMAAIADRLPVFIAAGVRAICQGNMKNITT